MITAAGENNGLVVRFRRSVTDPWIKGKQLKGDEKRRVILADLTMR